jgi:AraC family transcriptional regulator
MSSQLHKDVELDTGEFKFFRKCTRDERASAVNMHASQRGVLLGVSLKGGHRRRIFSGHRWTTHDFDPGSVYLRDFSDDYKAQLSGGFDFLLVELSRSFIADACYERCGSSAPRLSSVAGRKDPILAHLAQVLALTLDSKSHASALFMEQLGVTIGTHLLDQYGHAVSRSKQNPRRLSRVHEARAKDMLLARAQDNVSLEAIANACNLSRSYFIRAFRETTDRTPHQWLLERRIERARELLKHTDAPLSEIAMTCGFADQSHFTRTFSHLVGMPPGTWRRQANN